MDTIEFTASFPPIQSAIKTGRDGARIQLDIPASELPAIVRLMALVANESLLRVTIEAIEPDRVEESLCNGGSKAHNRTAKRPTDMAGR